MDAEDVKVTGLATRAVERAEPKADLIDRPGADRQVVALRKDVAVVEGDAALPSLGDLCRFAGENSPARPEEHLSGPDRVLLFGAVVVGDETVDRAGAEDESVMSADLHHV